MDFKSLIQKIESLDDSIVTPKAPTLPKSIQLSEGAQLRVLSGQTTILAESAKKAASKNKQKAANAKKPAIKKPVNKAPIDDEVEDKVPTFKKSAKNESAEYDDFTLRFMNMVESRKSKKKAPDEDGDGIPDFVDSDSENASSSKKKSASKKKPTDKKSPVSKKKPTDKKSSGPAKKGLTPKQEKFFGKKKTVKESYEPILTFRDMIRLVQESGGQQQIDPVDQELWQWAQRVAVQKFVEGAKAEMYAGLVYERMGGVFEMYDILSESN